MSTPTELLSQYTNQAQISNYFTDKLGIISILSYTNESIYDGATSCWQSLTDAINDISTNGGMIFLPSTVNGSTYVIDKNITISSNITLWFANGAKIKRTNGAIITLNCNIEAGLHKIFEDDGTGSWSGIIKVKEIYPEWFGAKGDGATNDAASLQAALNFATISKNKILFQKVYGISSTLTMTSNIIIELTKNGTLLPLVAMDSMFSTPNATNFKILGNSAIIDLNNLASRFLYMSAGADDGINSENIDILDITIKNKPTVTVTNAAAIRIAGARDINIQNVKVFDYANSNVLGGNECYGLAINYCEDINVENYKSKDCFIGILTQGVKNLTIDGFRITDTIDNGIYNLSSSPSENIKILNGLVDGGDEGIVVKNDGTEITNCKIINCTNKGISLREGIDVNIAGCSFKGNKYDIDNDFDGTASNAVISDCKFYDTTEAFIRSRSDGWTFDNCTFKSQLLNDATHALNFISVDNTTIKASSFEANVSASKLMRFSGDSKCNNNKVSNCDFNGIEYCVEFFLSGGMTGGNDNSVTDCTIYNVTTFVSGNGSSKATISLKNKMSAAPTTGSWQKGTYIYNSAPSPSDYVGWVCTTAGSPGTWKGFGTIQS